MSDHNRNGTRTFPICPRCEGESYLTLFRSTDRLYGTTGQRFNVVECSRCALIRLEPLPSAEQLKAFYPERYWWKSERSVAGRLAELYRQVVLLDHIRFVLHSMDRAGLTLDVGCGGGSFLHALRKRGVPVVGIDSSFIAARRALTGYSAPAVCGSPSRFPFWPGAFRTVTMFHLLEHLPDPMGALLAIGDLLAVGGRLFVQVPNAACWQFLLFGQRWSGLNVPRHLIHFRAEDLEELLVATGFEVKRRKFFSLRDNPAGLASSLCPQLEPVARRVRHENEGPAVRLLKDMLYFGLVVAATPLALVEAAAAAGSTVMIEAVRKE